MACGFVFSHHVWTKPIGCRNRRITMADVLLTFATVALFAVALLYVNACDRLKARKSND